MKLQHFWIGLLLSAFLIIGSGGYLTFESRHQVASLQAQLDGLKKQQAVIQVALLRASAESDVWKMRMQMEKLSHTIDSIGLDVQGLYPYLTAQHEQLKALTSSLEAIDEKADGMQYKMNETDRRVTELALKFSIY